MMLADSTTLPVEINTEYSTPWVEAASLICPAPKMLLPTASDPLRPFVATCLQAAA